MQELMTGVGANGMFYFRWLINMKGLTAASLREKKQAVAVVGVDGDRKKAHHQTELKSNPAWGLAWWLLRHCALLT